MHFLKTLPTDMDHLFQGMHINGCLRDLIFYIFFLLLPNK